MESNDKLRRIEKKHLPLFYRLILKIPMLKITGSFSGFFWTVICPIFILLNSFINFFILIYFKFPINVVLASLVPIFLLIILVKVTLKRLINWWNNFVVGGYTRRDVNEVLNEYMALINKEKEKSSKQHMPR
ncbi:hypothetical protein DRO54_00890 [Candidatus Bathyarchaeota archaeon]|nr:MAG: hypothetical protein DRO54_00890 [Candidatus Bathyarchaeota archaeon]